jgi:CBS domain-containing protein
MSADTDRPKKSITPVKSRAAQRAGVLHPGDNVEAAGERMRKNEAGAWPVVEDNKLVGMVAGKNPDWKVGGHGHNPTDEKVGDIMNREAIFCREDDDCAYAEELMREHGLSHIPVVDREMRVVGIFSKREIEVMLSGNDAEKKIASRAMEIAAGEGRAASSEDDFVRAKSEFNAAEDMAVKQGEDPPNCHA